MFGFSSGSQPREACGADAVKSRSPSPSPSARPWRQWRASRRQRKRLLVRARKQRQKVLALIPLFRSKPATEQHPAKAVPEAAEQRRATAPAAVHFQYQLDAEMRRKARTRQQPWHVSEKTFALVLCAAEAELQTMASSLPGNEERTQSVRKMIAARRSSHGRYSPAHRSNFSASGPKISTQQEVADDPHSHPPESAREAAFQQCGTPNLQSDERCCKISAINAGDEKRRLWHSVRVSYQLRKCPR